MSSILARLRAIAFTIFSLAIFSHAIEGSLFTSSVTYCAPPETLLIQQFDLEYFAANQSVSFNISAESVEANVNVTASLLVNVFGLVPVNITIDLCGILGGALCPLPEYNFTGSDSISLPDAFSSKVKIPGIAFKVPDLEGYAQLTLVEVGTGDVKACVQATLSNGLSTHQKSVEWTLGGITIFTLLVSMWQSLSPTAILPYRFLDMIALFQSIATSAMLNLDYPVVYRSYALNFAWALSLFSSGGDRLQGAINNMRALTGGGLANSTTGSAVAFVDRQLSPFNSQLDSSSSGGLSSLYSIASRSLNSTTLQQRDVVVVTPESGNVLSEGLSIFVSSMNISAANSFMTVFLCTLMLIAIALFVFGVAWASIFAMERYRLGREDQRLQLRHTYPSWIRSWTLRLCLIMSTPIIIFAFFQWTLKDSWLSTLFSVFSFLAIMGAIIYPCFVVIRSVRRSEPSVLHTDPVLLGSYGPLYAQYRPTRYYSFLPGACRRIPQSNLHIVRAIEWNGTSYSRTPSRDCSSWRCTCAAPSQNPVNDRVCHEPGHCCHLLGDHPHQKTATSPSDDSSYSDLFGRPRNPTPERNVPLDPEINQPYSPSTPTATIDYSSTRQRDSESTTFGSVLPRRWSFTPLHTPTDSSALDHSPPFDSTLPRTSEEHSSN
ncbi:hypothetical protein BT96DRAFT_918699 [Gymnopus androsaceus JB14]|uniref:ML-like domain-containing protein n=1 Tax=Gymnopus androsaceus JB14 TaxID=1447944 RepID=A0A6A4HT24_9AGAR|nr:hypothetical protein BT96DRAFT_918699 [Gymnopus androsaceus JB14]